jgi:hypothetical protein
MSQPRGSGELAQITNLFADGCMVHRDFPGAWNFHGLGVPGGPLGTTGCSGITLRAGAVSVI